MIKLVKNLVHKRQSLQYLSRFNYFKENLSQVYENQSSQKYTISQINSMNDERIFQEESKNISQKLNEFTSTLYEKMNIINPLKLKAEYTQNECLLIGDILQNRMLFINLRISKLQEKLQGKALTPDMQNQLIQNYMQFIILALDLYNFSIICNSWNNHLNTTFSKIFNEWMNYFNKNETKDTLLNSQVLVSLSRIFQSSLSSQNNFLNKLNFDIYQCTQFLMQLLSHQLSFNKQNNENKDQIQLLDIQIDILYQLQKLSEQSMSQINKIDSANEFKQQFKENMFYRFWIDIQSQEDIQDPNISLSQQVQNEFIQKSSIDNLLLFLLEEVFDGILLKRKVCDPNNLIKIIQIFNIKKLNEIPSECFMHLIEQSCNSKQNILKCVDLITQKEIYSYNLNQKTAFYHGFYNFITVNYLSSLNSYLNKNLRFESQNEEITSQQNQQDNQVKLNLVNIADIFKIMQLSSVVDFQFLKLLESTLSQNNQIQKLKHQDFIKIVQFFGNFPLQMDVLTKNQINFYLNKHFEKMNNQQKIQCSVEMLKLESQPEAPLYQLVQSPLFCTIENMSLITDFIIQFNSQPNKTLQEKIQFYFLTQTFFKDQIKISKYFEDQINDLKEAFVKAGFSKISEFQKQILQDLIKQDKKENPNSSQLKNIESELFLEDIFSVDYLINQDIVVEVNGPYHYYLVSGIPINYNLLYNQKVNDIDTFQDNINFIAYSLLENRNTIIKTTILSKLYKYKVKNIPFISYEKYKFLNKHTQLVYELVFSNKPLKDLEKII
ncbi:hypothetical protein ABPG72_009690 [Tetrahymena utriculariae]